MEKKIYLTGIEKKSGKSFLSLGLAAILKEEYKGFRAFKLFSAVNKSETDVLKRITNSNILPLMDINQAIAMMRDEPDTLFSRVFQATEDTKNEFNLTYFEGSDFESDSDTFEYEFNISLAYQLDCEVILAVSAKDRTLEHTFSLITSALNTAKKNHARVIAVIINRVSMHKWQALEKMSKEKNMVFVVVPEFEELANPCVGDVAQKLNAQIICGEHELYRMVNQLTIAAKTVGNFLGSRLDRKDMLIITPGDRVDILLGSLLADQSANYPKIAGIVLTGGEMPAPVILNIITGLEDTFPILLTSNTTYDTATVLYSARYRLNLNNMSKVNKVITATSHYLSAPILSLLQKQVVSRLSPAIFIYNLVNKAKKIKRHIVLPEGADPRILTAADYLLKQNIVDITLLGNPKKINFLARKLQLDLPGVSIIEVDKSPKKALYASIYFKLRQHKNINLPIAMERMADVNYFAAMMVYCSDADAMVSGAEHTTADTVRPALEIIKTKPGLSKVSSIFIMCMPKRILIYGDCAINPEPDSETLMEITREASKIAKRLGIDPKVALLSYSTGSSGKGQSVDKIINAMTMIRKEMPLLLVEGPIQYDAAVDEEVAAKKIPHSKLKGQANVLIFPDLNTGNNTYKAVQRESGALAIGPVLLGLNKPINDLSRGTTAEDIINTVLVTAIQVGEDDVNTNH